MDNMIAFTISGRIAENDVPAISIGFGSSGAGFRPQNPLNNSYWIAIIDRNDPKKLVKDFVVPGQNNSTVPAGLDTYMSNLNYLFVIATQNLSTLSVPQGDFYDYLVKYGAGRELQRLEQINTVLSCGRISRMSYILTGLCGPRGLGSIPPPSYEFSSIQVGPLVTMSLMGPKAGGGPYSICDHNTFKTR